MFSLVEPEDIRWVFISHDDIDHTGNLNALMELAPNATLIVNWFMTERMGAPMLTPVAMSRRSRTKAVLEEIQAALGQLVAA